MQDKERYEREKRDWVRLKALQWSESMRTTAGPQSVFTPLASRPIVSVASPDNSTVGDAASQSSDSSDRRSPKTTTTTVIHTITSLPELHVLSDGSNVVKYLHNTTTAVSTDSNAEADVSLTTSLRSINSSNDSLPRLLAGLPGGTMTDPMVSMLSPSVSLTSINTHMSDLAAMSRAYTSSL